MGSLLPENTDKIISEQKEETRFVTAIRARRHCAFLGLDSISLCLCGRRATRTSSFNSCREGSRHG